MVNLLPLCFLLIVIKAIAINHHMVLLGLCMVDQMSCVLAVSMCMTGQGM